MCGIDRSSSGMGANVDFCMSMTRRAGLQAGMSRFMSHRLMIFVSGYTSSNKSDHHKRFFGEWLVMRVGVGILWWKVWMVFVASSGGAQRYQRLAD